MPTIKMNKRFVKIFLVILVVYTVASGTLVVLNALGLIMVVEGTSMVPTYHDGDLLIIQRNMDKDKIEVQDIIIFHSPSNWNQLIVHRVIERVTINNQLYFRTRGDNNNIADQWYVPEDNVEAVVTWNIPLLGQMLIIIYNPIVRVTIAGLAISFIIVEIFYGRNGQKHPL